MKMENELRSPKAGASRTSPSRRRVGRGRPGAHGDRVSTDDTPKSRSEPETEHGALDAPAAASAGAAGRAPRAGAVRCSRAARGRRRRSSPALIVTFFTVDLGPRCASARRSEGSNFLERPMHIGRLSAKMTPGVFVVEDLVIEGLTPTDRPFLKAKKITVKLPWWTAS